jgi:transposase
MEVMIGVDPHKASHHAFAVDDAEAELAHMSVRASREQVHRLLAWGRAIRSSDVGHRGR